MSIMLQFELFYILEIFHTCLIFENNASQVFLFSPSFYKQQRIAEVAKLHHIWQPPGFSWNIISYPTAFPACQRRRGREGRQKSRPGLLCAAHSCQPQAPVSGTPSSAVCPCTWKDFCDQIVMRVLEGDKVRASL